MIFCDFLGNPEGELLGFSMEGHAGCGQAGEDIVCAAVSSAAYLTVNTVTDVLFLDAKIEAEDGYLLLKVPAERASQCRTVLEGFKLHMQGLEEQYPKNINVSYREV